MSTADAAKNTPETTTKIGGGGGKEGRADDIGHARPEESVDKIRFLKDKFDEYRGCGEKHARDHHESERVPGEFEVRNEHGTDYKENKRGKEGARKILVEEDECQVRRHDRGYGSHNGDGVRGVAALERRIEEKYGEDERRRGKQRQCDECERRHGNDAERHEHEHEARHDADIKSVHHGFPQMLMAHKHVFIDKHDTRRNELGEYCECYPRDHAVSLSEHSSRKSVYTRTRSRGCGAPASHSQSRQARTLDQIHSPTRNYRAATNT